MMAYFSDNQYHTLDVSNHGRTSKNGDIPLEIDRLYSKSIAVSDLKKQNLMTLCRTQAIPQEFHSWHESILSDGTKRDTAPEPSLLSDGLGIVKMNNINK